MLYTDGISCSQTWNIKGDKNVFFFKKFKDTLGKETKEEIAFLREWETLHFQATKIYKKFYLIDTYVTDTGERIDLSGITLPHKKKPEPKTFLEKVAAKLEPNDPPPMLTTFIANYRDNIYGEINVYKENLAKHRRLKSEFSQDPLFAEIDHVFSIKLRILRNELEFCKFRELGNAQYFEKMKKKLLSIVSDLNKLNSDFNDYMYALTNTEYENTTQELENIRIRVEAMSSVAENNSSETFK